MCSLLMMVDGGTKCWTKVLNTSFQLDCWIRERKQIFPKKGNTHHKRKRSKREGNSEGPMRARPYCMYCTVERNGRTDVRHQRVANMKFESIIMMHYKIYKFKCQMPYSNIRSFHVNFISYHISDPWYRSAFFLNLKINQSLFCPFFQITVQYLL